jgi:hypothetical protein
MVVRYRAATKLQQIRDTADKVVELNYIDSISHETVRRILKKTKSNRGNVRSG